MDLIATRDVRQPPRGGRGRAGGARAVARHPDRGPDDLPRRRPDRVRRERGPVPCRRSRSAGADAVGMNCTLGPQETQEVFARLPASIDAPLSVMPNAGYPTVAHGRNVYLSSPDYLREYARAFVEAGAAIVGRLLRHDSRAHPRDGARGRRPRARRGRADLARRRGDAGPAGGGARRRDLPLQAPARRSGRLRRHVGGRAAARRRRLRRDRGGAPGAGRGRACRQRHRQSDGAAPDVVDRGRGSDPARDGPRGRRPDHDARSQRPRPPVGPARGGRARRPRDPVSRRRPVEDRRLPPGEAGLGGGRARASCGSRGA